MPQTTSGRIRTNASHLRTEFRRGFAEEDLDRSHARWPLAVAVDLFMIVLFGFVLVSPAVPFLPWGEPAGILIALVAVGTVAVARFIRSQFVEMGVLVIVFGCATLTARVDELSTSLLLAGAVVAAITKTASGITENHTARPFLYGFVAALFVIGVVIATFDLTPPLGQIELIFSGEAFSPDAAGRQATLVAAIVFLGGLQHVAAIEIRRHKERAIAAELARDEAAADERARIARELHDVVSHHVTAMTLQAEAAAATGDRTALTSLASSGREAAAELRRMLGVLRRPADDAHGAEAADPQPRLEDLDGLARRLSSGLDVKLERTGRIRPLPAGVELCAFRVIQEALTNVAKHSDAREARVAVDYALDHLSLEVCDEGRPVRPSTAQESGHGLIGMGERVSLLDGTLSAGPRQDGNGYRVFARIPLQP